MYRAQREPEAVAPGLAAIPAPGIHPTVADSTLAHALTPRSTGVPLDASTRTAMALHFAHDFSRIRVHHGPEAADLATAVNARAYTVGNHLVFGRDQYAPGTSSGYALLTHELRHVLQQSAAGAVAVQRDDLSNPAPKLPSLALDPEAALGQRLSKDFPSGIAVAFYAPMPDAAEEARNAAQKWAKREQALAIKGKMVTATNTVFGDAMSDDEHPLSATIQAIGKMLSGAVAKAPPNPDGPLPPGMGPATVRTLAVFAHGTSDWCGLGAITSSKAASIIKGIAPALAPNVTVVLYSCNAGRDPDASEDWVKGTMQSGGSKSLAAVTRDALIAEGLGGSVWGHTTTGHVTENFALREFDTTSGAGSEGASFVARYVFTGADKVVTSSELLNGVLALGYEITSPRAAANADASVENEMYRCYAEANRELRFGGGKLAESAPVHAVEVGKQIKDYWTATYWPGRKAKAIDDLAKALVGAGRARRSKAPATP